MNPEPLPENIYESLTANNVTNLSLLWLGGNDEGHLTVELFPEKDTAERESLKEKITDWAYNAYSYNGAGDGNDYGDDINYNLLTKEVTVESWAMTRSVERVEGFKLEIEGHPGKKDKKSKLAPEVGL